MMLLRLLNPQGLAGLAASLCLAVLLLIQKSETRHWSRQSTQFEQLYHDEQAAFAATTANYRAAAAQAAAEDQANAAHVAATQRAINERTSDAYEARIAAARARFDELRRQAGGAAADPGRRPGAPVPGLPAAAGGAAQATGEDRLPATDRQLATEQAIQLDELIKWTRAQARVDAAGGAPK